MNFHGERRTQRDAPVDHRSRRPARQEGAGPRSALGYLGHVLMEHRSGLIVERAVTPADRPRRTRRGAGRWSSDLRGQHRVTVAADKGYDTRDFVATLRAMDITPHVAQNTETARRSAIDGRTTRHPGYAISQRKRKRVEKSSAG